MKKILVAAIILIFPSLTIAENIPKQKWFQHMSTNMPKMACKNNNYHRCEKFTSAATDACLEIFWGKIPDPLQMPSDGAKYGSLVGNCTQDVMTVLLKYEE